MDKLILELSPAVFDDDLVLCPTHGVAYQRDRSHIINYDAAYYDRCASYEGNDIARAVTAGRLELVRDHIGLGPMVDVGIGGGEFVKARNLANGDRPNTRGHDVNPVAMEWLKRNDLWCERLSDHGAFSFWDVIEHVETPAFYFDRIPLHSYLFASIPIFYALGAIRLSKHYRPGEHLFYFTEDGFVRWMDAHGFMLLERRDFEIQAGRESILDFAFKRYKCPPSN